MNETKGRYLGFYSYSAHGFVYEYTCTSCGRVFRSTAPEQNNPIVCHTCFYGVRDERNKDRRKKLQEMKQRRAARGS